MQAVGRTTWTSPARKSARRRSWFCPTSACQRYINECKLVMRHSGLSAGAEFAMMVLCARWRRRCTATTQCAHSTCALAQVFQMPDRRPSMQCYRSVWWTRCRWRILGLAKRADLESTHLGHPKRVLLTTVGAVSCGFRLLAGGCM
jgi:hypothetical protein